MLAFSFLSLASLALAAPLARRQATDAISSREPIAARWQMQNGTRQACGNYSSDLDFVVGLPLALYNTSSPSPLCGAFVVVTNPLNSLSAIAKVVGASNSSALALSVAAWREIRGDATEMQDVSFRFANESETATGAAYAAANFNDASPNPSTTSTSTGTTPTFTPTAQIAAASSSSSSSSAPSSSASSSSTSSSVTSTSSSSQSAPTSSGSSSGGSFSGGATFYTQGGAAGACGDVNEDSSFIVAMATEMYASSVGKGPNCGRQVSITRTSTGKTITATVADKCPGCKSSGSLDLSVAAFNSLADPSVGLFDITWSFA